jgi:hypothetical protein
MGTDFNITPVGGPVAASVVRPQPDAVKNAVQTELPAPQAPTAADASSNVRSEPQANSSSLSNQAFIDRAAGEVVYRVVDNRTSLVVSQYPDDARLRARAYFRAQDQAKQDNARLRRLDQKA